MKENGILYFLVNNSMPGLVKIGYTTGVLTERLQQLSTTGVPSPFLVAALFYVNDAKDCEKEVHKILSKYRGNPKREFFSQSTSVLLQESIGVIGKYIESSESAEPNKKEEAQFEPDEDDIYFMLYLLHESYETNTPFSAAELSQHHANYASLEVELKLINLEKMGM